MRDRKLYSVRLGDAVVTVGWLAVALVAVLAPWGLLGSLATRLPGRMLLVVGIWAGGVLLTVVMRRRRRDAAALVESAGFLAWWWIPIAAVIVVAAGTVTSWWLLGRVAATDPIGSERARAQIEAVRTGLTAAGGVGAAMALLLAFRRQQHQERTAAETEHDAVERRITELYTKAVEQLGSEKAAVRLGGLYALERLAQSHPDHRQTVVDVLCAYLRMPILVPAEMDPWMTAQPEVEEISNELPGKDIEARPTVEIMPVLRGHTIMADDPAGERQVRLTAQRILTVHLRGGQSSTEAGHEKRYWQGMRLDLTGAVLPEFDFTGCHPGEVVFSGVTFDGTARFSEVTFSGTATFREATFRGPVTFDQSTFSGAVNFDEATFSGPARFTRVTFAGLATFSDARFGLAKYDDCPARFDNSRFSGDTWFQRTVFSGDVAFDEVEFGARADFRGVRFKGIAYFAETVFKGPTFFSFAPVPTTDSVVAGTLFEGPARFEKAVFGDNVTFELAVFHQDARFDEATFSGDSKVFFRGTRANVEGEHVWPSGWVLSTDADQGLALVVQAEGRS